MSCIHNIVKYCIGFGIQSLFTVDIELVVRFVKSEVNKEWRLPLRSYPRCSGQSKPYLCL